MATNFILSDLKTLCLPTMATTYTLSDFKSYALQNYPEAYEIIADVNSYSFERITHEPLLNPPEIEFLHVAYWHNKRHEIPIWAKLSKTGNSVRYYYGKREKGVMITDEPYSNKASANIRSYLAPFHFVVPQNWSSTLHDKDTSQTAATRNRLALLIKFAFLLTGRVTKVTSDNKKDLLLEFKKMCAFVQNVIGAEEEQTRGKRENKNLTTGTGKTNDGVHHAIINEAEAPAARSPANVQAVTSKRVAEIFNADCPKPRDKHSIDTNKRHKSSHSQSGNTPATLASSQATYASGNMMDSFMMEFEEHKRVLLGLREEETLAYRREIAILKRLLETKVQEKTASRQEIELLKKQVAGKEIEKQKASQQIAKLQAQQNLKEEQTLVLQSQLAKTETEAKEWKVRYRKLDAKVQSFVDSI